LRLKAARIVGESVRCANHFHQAEDTCVLDLDAGYSEHFIADVEIVVSVAAALARKDAVVGILNWVSQYCGPEGGSHLHALQNEVDTDEAALAVSRQSGCVLSSGRKAGG
jgi:hypothetical protein